MVGACLHTSNGQWRPVVMEKCGSKCDALILNTQRAHTWALLTLTFYHQSTVFLILLGKGTIHGVGSNTCPQVLLPGKEGNQGRCTLVLNFLANKFFSFALLARFRALQAYFKYPQIWPETILCTFEIIFTYVTRNLVTIIQWKPICLVNNRTKDHLYEI